MVYQWLERRRRSVIVALLSGSAALAAFGQTPEQHARIADDVFPVSVQFSRVPSGPGWRNETPPISPEVMRLTIQNIIDHGFTNLSVGAFSGDQTQDLLRYAQARGMQIDFTTNGFEMFDRVQPPAISVYSPRYADAVRAYIRTGQAPAARPGAPAAAGKGLAPVRQIERIHTVFPFKDEPFHAGPESFDYSMDARVAFRKQYGYDMPDSLGAVRNDPRRWLDLLNFQSSVFPEGWRQVYKVVKEFDARPKVVMTHDSHSTFGAGVNSNAKVAMDDVFHWGGDYADIFIYDIYPYTMFDYRYGEAGRLPKPRLSQMHYTISQLRNVTTTYNKELGFWVGTFNQRWFKRFMSEEMRQQYWAEQELAMTAVAHGANFLITGLNIPEDSLHWENFGSGMKLLQKAGPGLLRAPKVKARACFLFPRTQYLQLQEEYYNVGLTFELFLRAFGELDILHEEQVTDDNLNGYDMLVLADVKLLPEKVARHIEAFVRKGGTVVADCVPQLNELKEPFDVMNGLFGVSGADTRRIRNDGQWVPFTTLPPKLSFPPPADRVSEPVRTDRVSGQVFGSPYHFGVVSPRALTVSKGNVLLSTESGQPALVRNALGRGKAYLLGFCLQDTYFGTWKHADVPGRDQLRMLLGNIIRDSKVVAHVSSSNPEIEASLRANASEGYLFVINHEATKPDAVIRLSELPFSVKRIVDIDSGEDVAFTRKNGVVTLKVLAPFATTRLMKVVSGK